MFFFKRKKIHLDCFTNRVDVFEYSKIDYTTKFYPDWWKKLPKQRKIPNLGYEANTMKSCRGFIDYFQYGITIPLWSDFAFQSDENQKYSWNFSDLRSSLTKHDAHQMEGFISPSNYLHMKIISPWFFRCKKDIKFAWTENTWHMNDLMNLRVVPAVLDFKYNYTTNINVFLEYSNSRSFVVKHGTPLVNLLPLTEHEVVINCHYDPVEHKKIDEKATKIKFNNFYNYRKKILQSKESKCPFGFSK
jgi:hypothetical protein